MFDTHCHLNFSVFKKNTDEVYDTAQKAGVKYFLVPGTDILSSQKAVDLAHEYEGVYAAAGIHPHHVFSPVIPTEVEGFPSLAQDYSLDYAWDDINKLEKLLIGKKVVAVGEVGIDKHMYKQTKYKDYEIEEGFVDRQKELFKKQIDLALKHGKSLIIHNWEAKEEVLKVLSEKWDEKLKDRTVFHCCEPDGELLEFAVNNKIFIGVDGDITYNVQKQEFVKKIPLDRLVLETDSPFLLPEPLRTQKKYPNEPKNLPIIAQFIADIIGVEVDELSRITVVNSLRLFGLN